MFLPIGDEPNPRRFPLVNYGLIAANVLVFLFVSLPLTQQPPDRNDPALREYVNYVAEHNDVSPREVLAQASAYDVFTFAHGFKPAQPSVLSLFFSLFLHGGWLHLLGNMLFLWIYGDNVEGRLGRVGYLAAYLGTGVAATLFFALFQLDSTAPLIGASGAISGVLGAYFWWFPQNRVKLLVVLFFFVDVWRVPARWVLGVYLVWDNLLPVLLGGASDGGVAHGAHIGGFAAGLVTAMVLGRGKGAEAPRDDNAGAWVLDRHGRPLVEVEPAESFRSLVRRGRFLDAAELYVRMSLGQRTAEADGDILALAQGLRDLGRPEAAMAVLQTFIAQRPMSPSLAEAHYLAAIIHVEHTGRLLAARQHLLQVFDLEPPEAIAEEARHALDLVEDALRRQGDADPH
jgi:membrane associated rhomboid family serine protease